MNVVPCVVPGSEEEASTFEHAREILDALAAEVGEINQRLHLNGAYDHAADIERRSELLTLWWSEWLRALPLGRAAGIPMAELRELQPPI